MANSCFDRSEYILKRLMLLRYMEAPTISDARQNFGDDLAEKIFCNCDPNFRFDLGLEPPLRGIIGKDLWSSPSDLLIGKVRLKPPLTTKHNKALTHQGILDIGFNIEKLLWNQIEIEKGKEIEEQEETLRILYESSKKEAIADVQKRMREIFTRQKIELIDEMETLCKKEMKRIEAKHYRDLQDELKEQAAELELFYQSKIEEEVTKTSEEITIQSTINLEELEVAMQKTFQAQLQKIEIQAKFEVQKEYATCKEKLKSLRHELECKNLANMMYIICMERKKFNYEKYAIEQDLTMKLKELEGILCSRNEQIAKITAERDKHKREIEIRERALLEVIKEFQKFIYFALKSDPKQAEYLLCAEKLMVFELTDALSKIEIASDYDRNYLWNRTPSESDSTQGSLKIKDGHDCLNEPEISESELSLDQFLPGFFYNDQAFVREDFRNMVSQNITINENNMLWTKHVQDILDVLQYPCQSCVFNEEKEMEKKKLGSVEKKRSIASYQSSVHFSLKERDKTSMNSIDKEKKIKRASLKPVVPAAILQTIDFNNIGSEENRKTLISAKNSVELIKDSITKRRSSVRSEELWEIREIIKGEGMITHGNIGSESKFLLEAKDSIMQTKAQKGIQSTTAMSVLNEEEVTIHQLPNRTISKLVAATDSLEVLKRKESAVISQNNQADLCILNDCDMVNQITISEELESETHTQNLIDQTQRLSIAFTGKPVIYGKNHKDKNKIVKKIVKHSKKTKDTKTKGFTSKVAGKPLSEVSTQTSFEEPKQQQQQQQSIGTDKLVMGDSNCKFDNQTNNQFTSERIASFIDLMKEHPNLMRLFTSVTR